MKRSKQIQLVLISSFLASCATHNPEEWSQQNSTNPNPIDTTAAEVYYNPNEDTCTPNNVVRLNDYWLWHGSFRPYTYYYRFCEPTKRTVQNNTRRPGSYPNGGFTPNVKPGIVQRGFGATLSAVAS